MGKNCSLLDDILQLPEVISMAERLKQGRVLSLNGVAESARPFVILLSAVIIRRPFCILASSVKQQEYLYSEISALLAAFKNEGDGIAMFYFPEMEIEGSDQFSDIESVSEVFRTLRALQESKKIARLKNESFWIRLRACFKGRT